MQVPRDDLESGPDELPFLNVQRYLAGLTDAVPAVYGFTAGYAEVTTTIYAEPFVKSSSSP